MQAESWKRQIGDEVFDYIVDAVEPDDENRADVEEDVAAFLTAAAEVGFTVPTIPPKIDPRGTRVFWPRHDGGSTAFLTAQGLVEHYAVRGQGFFLLRVRQLVRGCAGPLFPRLQEVLAAYEDQCEAEGVDPVPEHTPGFVVGGKGPIKREWAGYLLSESPEPKPDRIRRKTVSGPG